MADIHSWTSFSDLVTNQWTLLPGLLPTAITWSSPTLAGREGREGILAVNWPAATRSGLEDTLTPDTADPLALSPGSYHASRESV